MSCVYYCCPTHGHENTNLHKIELFFYNEKTLIYLCISGTRDKEITFFFVLVDFVYTDFVLHDFALADFVLTDFVLTDFALTDFVLTGFI